MGFDIRVAEALGLALCAYLVIWFVLRMALRKAATPPAVSLQLFAIALGLWIGGRVFYPSEVWVGHLGAAAVFFTAIFLWVILDLLLAASWLEKRRDVPIPGILRQLAGVLVVLAAGAVILKWGYGLQLTGLVATSGIAAVILGFAMQDLLSNVIAGFSIHMTRAYKVGDWLLISEDGRRAEVTEISWRSTRLMDNDRISYEMPNSDIVKNRIVNLNRPDMEHGVRLRVGLDYDTPPTLAKEVLLKCAKNAQGVLEHPAPVVFTRDFVDSSVTYELRFWMLHARLYNVTCDEIRTALWYELSRRGMRIPFPTRSLEVREPNTPAHHVSKRENAAAILRGGAMFGSLDEGEAQELVAQGSFQLYGPGEAIVTRGDAGESMFLVLDGMVEVIGRTSTGPRVVMARLGMGDAFGEMSLVTGEPRNATVRASGEVLVLEITKAHLAPLMAGRPELAQIMAKVLADRKSDREETLGRAEPQVQAAPVYGSTDTHSLVKRIRRFFAQSGD